MSVENSVHGFTSHSEDTLTLSRLKYLQISKRNGHHDLLAFLSQAQKLGVDMLSLTWNSSQVIGKGGFAVLNQSTIHKHFSFALKRIISQGSEPSDHGDRIESIMTEMAVLMHDSIRKHPHILTLEGICWEVNTSTQGVVPILVFEKAQEGDLMQFMNTERGRSLSITDRVALCLQVAKALEMLHLSGVIHGDLKPENILVFSGDAGPFAKISDFGSSIIVDEVENGVILPTSEPWTAPENHHRGVTVSQAYGMDLYRFTLVLLWLIIGFNGERDALESTVALRRMRHSENLRSAALEHLKSSTIESAIKASLCAIFEASLADDPAERIFALSDIIHKLSVHRYAKSSEEPWSLRLMWKRDVESQQSVSKVVHLQYHMDFHIAYDLYPLLYANYLVRRLIFLCLQDKIKASKCKRCLRRSKFQLAFCYYIGFGIERSISSACERADECQKTMEDLEDEADEVTDMHVIKNKATNQLQLDGFDISMDLLNEYRQDQYQVSEVICFYEREISGLKEAFPTQPLIVVVLEATVAALLGGSGQWKEASQIYKHLISVFCESHDHGAEHLATLNMSSRCAEMLRLQGQLHDAKDMIETALTAQSSVSEHNPQTLQAYSILGMIYHDGGDLAQAAGIFEDVLRVAEQLLGPEHIQVLHAMSNLASAYRGLGRLEDAEKLDLATLDIKKKLLDSTDRPHYSTLTSAANLALTYSNQKRHDKAEALETWVLEARLQALGPLNPATLTAKKNLASTYRSQGRCKSAEKLYLEVLQGQQQVLGNDHPQFLDSRACWQEVRDQLRET